MSSHRPQTRKSNLPDDSHRPPNRQYYYLNGSTRSLNPKYYFPNDGLFTAQKRQLLSESEFYYDLLRLVYPSRKLFFKQLRKERNLDIEFLNYLEKCSNWQICRKPFKLPELKSESCDRLPTTVFDTFDKKPKTTRSRSQPTFMDILIKFYITFFFASILFGLCSSHGLHEAEDKAHLKSHLQGSVDESHLDAMSVEELRFNYFKAHDADGNSKLDGCELTQAFVDYHAEEISSDPKIFSDKEIELVIDQILGAEDRNSDGFVDYTEFVASQERLDAHH